MSLTSQQRDPCRVNRQDIDTLPNIETLILMGYFRVLTYSYLYEKHVYQSMVLIYVKE